MEGVSAFMLPAIRAKTYALQHVAWVPLDTIGEIYVEWMFSPSALPPLLNLVHPKQTSWDVVIKGIMQGLGKPLPVVPFDKWIRQLGKLSANASKEELSSIVCAVLCLS